MPNEAFPEVAFLGWAERAASVHEGETNLVKWNVLGLKGIPIDEFLSLLAERVEFGLGAAAFNSPKRGRRDDKVQS